MKTIIFDAAAGQKIADIVSKPLEDIVDFWGLMGQLLDRDAMLAFRHSGARNSHPAWPPLSINTVWTRAGTRKIRYGTDLRPLDAGALHDLRVKWGWGHRGYMRKGIRRFSENSKPLLASGGFMRSFGVKWMDNRGLGYGTNHEKAEEIMSVRNRQVLFITPTDEKYYSKQFQSWFAHGLKRATS